MGEALRRALLAVFGLVALFDALLYMPRLALGAAAVLGAFALARAVLRRLSPLEREELSHGHRFNLPDRSHPAMPLRPAAEKLRAAYVRRAFRDAWRRPPTYAAAAFAAAGLGAASAAFGESGLATTAACLLVAATLAGVAVALTVQRERGD